MTRLRELRERSGMSQSKLAEITGIPLRTISRWECEGMPSIDKLNILSSALGVTPNDLLGVELKA